ncbi:MAG: hypothetical protein JXB62_03200 [Pirellulales bacterium]|nr:hypothetical protein [Pirellulales bacterium]
MARFISTDVAQSPLTIAEGGQLPGLQLQEGEQKKKPQAESTTVNPLVLFGAISVSIVLSVLLVLYDVEPKGRLSTTAQEEVRASIAREYFANLDSDEPLQPYQRYLREAQRAYLRGDHTSEQELYRKVLDLLRAERPSSGRGLTGSRSRDKVLEEQISILLGSR